MKRLAHHAALLVLALTGCGEGQSSWRGWYPQPLVVAPQTFQCTVGVPFEGRLLLSGGCGGRYVYMPVVGYRPPGIEIVPRAMIPGETSFPMPQDLPWRFTGTPTSAGRYITDWRISDTGCTPFDEVVARITWEIAPASSHDNGEFSSPVDPAGVDGR